MPDGWAWCRVGSITQFIRNGANIKQDKEAQGYPITRIETISNGEINTEKFGYANIFELEKFEKYLLHIDDILMSHINSPVHLGKSAIYDGNYETPIIHGMNLLCIRLVEKSSSYYLLYAFRTSLFKDFVWENMKQAVNQASITTASISSFLLPMAPFNEQRRITKTIKQCTNLIDRIENDKTNLQQILSVTKSKILDLAIRGKLVPQDPNDEPASVLLERIRAEKEELIKQGKIKRDKKESVIFKGDDNSYYLNKDGQCVDIGDDIPFDIPNSWEWTLLGNIIQLNPRNKISDNMEVSFVPMPLIDDGFSGNHVSEIRKWNDVKTGFTHFAEGDIGVAKITPCFENRKSTVFNNLCNGYGAGTTELHILRTYANTISHKFLLFFVKTDFFIQAGKQTFSGAVGQQRIGKEYISNSLFPLPPLAEQERIVNAVETLFAQIDKISEQIL